MQINTKELAAELDFAARFIDKKSTIPILGNVALIAEPGKIGLAATDLETAGISSVKTKGEGAWSVCVPARLTLEYLRKVEEEFVELNADGPILEITHGHGGKVTINGGSTESFPEIPAPKATVQLKNLAFAIPRVMFAIVEGAEKSRFTLNGAFMDIGEDGSRMVATDGHRLSLVDLDCEPKDKLRTLIHKKAMFEVNRLVKENTTVWFGMDDNHQIFITGKRAIVSRKLEGNFPDWGRVIPKDPPHKIDIPVTVLSKILDRVVLFGDSRMKGVKFDLQKGCLTVSAMAVEVGKASGQIPVSWDGKPVECGFRAPYLQDILKHCTAPLTEWHFTDVKGASLFTMNGWSACVMPLRLE